MQSVETMTQQILYWLSLDMQVRALAERLLDRFAVTVGDLPASAAHHHAEPRRPLQAFVEVGLKAVEVVRFPLIAGCLRITPTLNRRWNVEAKRGSATAPSLRTTASFP